jgi:glycosyltransferase involved in cell wall biosynthesis
VPPNIYLVDNNSESSETLDAINKVIEEYPDNVKLLSYGKAFNFSAINNFAVNQCTEDYIFFVNNDIEILTPGLFEAGIQCLEDS